MPQNATKTKQVKIMGYHHDAVELRYAGKKYNEIAPLLKEKYKREFREDGIRRWFMSGGILEPMYFDYAKKENDRRRQVIMEELKKLLPIIPEKYEALLSKRFETDMFGKYVTDEDGKKIEKLDSITRATLADLAQLLGFKIDDNTGVDPLEEYFNRAEKELNKPAAQNAE